MLASTIKEGDCARYISLLNADNPVEKEFAGLIQSADQAYLSADRPIYYDIDQNSLPSLPEDLLVVNTNALKVIADTWSKSIVNGTSYPIDKAQQDAQSAWEKAGGQKIDDFYKKWHADNKASVVLTKEWYSSKK